MRRGGVERHRPGRARGVSRSHAKHDSDHGTDDYGAARHTGRIGSNWVKATFCQPAARGVFLVAMNTTYASRPLTGLAGTVSRSMGVAGAAGQLLEGIFSVVFHSSS
jgi:hypothetical protein